MNRKGWLGKATVRIKRGMAPKLKALYKAEKSALASSRAAQPLPPPVQMAAVVRATDISQIIDRMKALPAKVFDVVMLHAAGKAMEPMRDAARANVQRRRGVLRRAIGMKKCRYQEGRIVDVLVGVRKDVRTDKDWPVKYAHHVEFGTRPHRVKPHAVKMRLGAFDGWIWVTQHPGSRPKPFLRPAYDQTKAAVAADFHDRVLRGVQAVVDGFGV